MNDVLCTFVGGIIGFILAVGVAVIITLIERR